MQIGNRDKGKHKSNDRWLLTYSDMITLLMVFFIMLYALSNINLKKYQELSSSLASYMGGGKKVFSVIDMDGSDQKSIKTSRAKSNNIIQRESLNQATVQKMQLLKDKVNTYLKNDRLLDKIDLELTQSGLEINLKDSVLFDSGEVAIKPDAKDKLLHIGRLIDSINNPIRIEGYTDDVPIKNLRYPSNLHLSAARAISVEEFLAEEAHIAPKRMSIVGYGEYSPRVPNTSDNNRKINRRVKLVLLWNN